MRRVAAAVLLVLSAPLVACDTSGYAFKVDETIEIVEPAARSEIDLPLLVRWTDEKPPARLRVDVADPDAEYYAVFIDRAPMGPGDRLESLLQRGTTCLPRQQCPTTQQLTDLNVHLVAEPALLLDFVADRRVADDSRDTHEVIIVRMRGDRRVGEAAFLQTFFVKR